MISTQDAEENSALELPQPPGFEKIEDLMSMPTERLQKSPLVNIIGLVKDYQPPIPTKGPDFKCTLSLVDLSTQTEHGMGIKVMIFWPEDKMPRISSVRDVVLLRKFKVQMWNGYISLLANWSSDIQVFPAAKISPGLLPKTTPSKSTPPSPAEAEYAAWLFHHVDNGLFPDAERFQEQTMNAMGVKDKYSLLKDVKAEHFYDLIGEVIRVYERDGRVTLYLSDYTAHTLFYNNVWGEIDADTSDREGDQYGYTKTKKKSANDWPGPYGKLSIQITAYDFHAAYIREQVKNRDWVILRNIQVKMGNQGGCLEGFLRGDRHTFESKVQVQIIRRVEDAGRSEFRWKDALRRRKEWWDKFKKQKQDFLEETQGRDKKRQLDDAEDSNPNSRKRRKEKRAAAKLKAIAIEQKEAEKSNLNLNVKCNNPKEPSTPLAKILYTPRILKSESGAEYVPPFENIKYRSDVCVIDFWPHKLEDFAVGRRVSEYDVLSDYSGGESTDHEEDMRLFREGKGYGGEKAWEWRFALRVQDAEKKARNQRDTMWLVVDNLAGQMLLKMDAVKWVVHFINKL